MCCHVLRLRILHSVLVETEKRFESSVSVSFDALISRMLSSVRLDLPSAIPLGKHPVPFIFK